MTDSEDEDELSDSDSGHVRSGSPEHQSQRDEEPPHQTVPIDLAPPSNGNTGLGIGDGSPRLMESQSRNLSMSLLYASYGSL